MFNFNQEQLSAMTSALDGFFKLTLKKTILPMIKYSRESQYTLLKILKNVDTEHLHRRQSYQNIGHQKPINRYTGQKYWTSETY